MFRNHILMQFMIFKQRTQRTLSYPGRIAWQRPLKAYQLYCLQNIESAVKRLGLRHKEIFVHTHLFHRGSSSQKTPQPG